MELWGIATSLHVCYSTRMMLSEAAKTALINVGTNRQGAQADYFTNNVDALFELAEAGLISKSGYGLTRRGGIERQRLLSAQLDSLFG